MPDARAAKPHRDLFVQAFSKAQINGLEPLIQDKISLFLRRLKEEAAFDKSIDLDFALNCLTADVTMNYCYQMSLGLLHAPGFRAGLIVQLHELGPMVPFFWCKLKISTGRLGEVLTSEFFARLSNCRECDEQSNLLPIAGEGGQSICPCGGRNDRNDECRFTP